MTKSELKFEIAKWAKKNAEYISMDFWAMPPDDYEHKEELLQAKDELENILTKANCEHIYENGNQVFPTGAKMSIILPPNFEFESYKWTSNDELTFKYKIKN